MADDRGTQAGPATSKNNVPYTERYPMLNQLDEIRERRLARQLAATATDSPSTSSQGQPSVQSAEIRKHESRELGRGRSQNNARGRGRGAHSNQPICAVCDITKKAMARCSAVLDFQ
jgi:hypothetical protein